MISMIAAMSQNRVIGNKGIIPWKIKGEQAYFKKVTNGHTVVMGRKTYDSIGKPLPGRNNVVLTRSNIEQPELLHDTQFTYTNDPEYIRYMHDYGYWEDVFIIGGGELYKEFLPYADRIFLTVVKQDFEGDAFFPELGEEWQLVAETPKEEPIPHSYLVYQRRKS